MNFDSLDAVGRRLCDQWRRNSPPVPPDAERLIVKALRQAWVDGARSSSDQVQIETAASRIDQELPSITTEDGDTRLRDEEIKRLRSLLEYDRTGLALALERILRVINGSAWLAEPDQWGSYECHERTKATLRGEIGEAFESMRKIAREALRASGDRAIAAHRPDTVRDLQAEVNQLRGVMASLHRETAIASGELLVSDAEADRLRAIVPSSSSPPPWSVSDESNLEILDAGNMDVARTVTEADAFYIVDACRALPKLLADREKMLKTVALMRHDSEAFQLGKEAGRREATARE